MQKARQGNASQVGSLTVCELCVDLRCPHDMVARGTCELAVIVLLRCCLLASAGACLPATHDRSYVRPTQVRPQRALTRRSPAAP